MRRTSPTRSGPAHKCSVSSCRRTCRTIRRWPGRTTRSRPTRCAPSFHNAKDALDLPIAAPGATAIEVAAVLASMRSPIVAVVDDSTLLGAVTVSSLLSHLRHRTVRDHRLVIALTGVAAMVTLGVVDAHTAFFSTATTASARRPSWSSTKSASLPATVRRLWHFTKYGLLVTIRTTWGLLLDPILSHSPETTTVREAESVDPIAQCGPDRAYSPPRGRHFLSAR